MHNGARCLSMYEHHCSQAISAFATKACVVATKSHMLNFCEVCAAMCCDCDLWKPIMQETKRFSVLRKKSKAQNKNSNRDFRKVVVSGSIPDGLRDLHTSKYKRLFNKPNDCCLRKLAKRKNVRTSKQLRFVASIETLNENQALGKTHRFHPWFYLNNISLLLTVILYFNNSIFCCKHYSTTSMNIWLIKFSIVINHLLCCLQKMCLLYPLVSAIKLPS